MFSREGRRVGAWDGGVAAAVAAPVAVAGFSPLYAQ